MLPLGPATANPANGVRNQERMASDGSKRGPREDFWVPLTKKCDTNHENREGATGGRHTCALVSVAYTPFACLCVWGGGTGSGRSRDNHLKRCGKYFQRGEHERNRLEVQKGSDCSGPLWLGLFGVLSLPISAKDGQTCLQSTYPLGHGQHRQHRSVSKGHVSMQDGWCRVGPEGTRG